MELWISHGLVLPAMEAHYAGNTLGHAMLDRRQAEICWARIPCTVQVLVRSTDERSAPDIYVWQSVPFLRAALFRADLL